MSEDFDPSPRLSKRRRTTRDGTKDNESNGEEIENVEDDATLQKNARSMNSPTAESAKTVGKDSRPLSKKASHVEAQAERDIHNAPSLSTPKVSRRGTRNDKTLEMEIPDLLEANGNDSASNPAPEATQLRSSGRQRRTPKRLAEAPEEDTPSVKSKRTQTIRKEDSLESRPTSPIPKGILTPSRKQRGRPRKSVMFNQEKEIEEQLGFRDINTPKPKKLPKKSTPHPRKSTDSAKPTITFAETEDEPPHGEAEFEDDMTLDEAVREVSVPEISTNSSHPIRSTDKDDPHLQECKQRILSRLTAKSLPMAAPAHLEPQHKQLQSLIKATVVSSESNSLLLLGPRGSGKTLLLDLVIRELDEEHQDDFHVVRLSGFLQTDDRLALREIWRQLGYSRGLDESETEEIGASYADTMASLLSLLGHPDEMMADDPLNNDVNILPGHGQRASKSIIFILDEFDLFTTHPRQTLLYNLFDIAQARKAPIVVIGCSSRMDVIECLEKRVKSRFSHRWLLVPGCRTLMEWEAELKSALTINADDEVVLNRDGGFSEWVQLWNECIRNQFLQQKDIQTMIKTHFYTTKSLPELFMALYSSIVTLEIPAPSSKAQTQHSRPGLDEKHLMALPSVLSAITTLPILHLSLLIAMSRLEAIHTLTTVNFNLVYTHYSELIDTSRLKQTAHGSVTHSGSLRKWGRETCREAWEELGIQGLMVPVVGGGRDDEGHSGGAEIEETRMWRSEVGLDDMQWGVKQKFDISSRGGGGAGETLLKWCKEV